ncbi:unnamed protein product, partial [Lepidochelys kempii]
DNAPLHPPYPTKLIPPTKSPLHPQSICHADCLTPGPFSHLSSILCDVHESSYRPYSRNALYNKHQDTQMRATLLVEKHVAIAVWKLETPDCYRSLANQFGVVKSTVGAVLTQVCKAINHILLRTVVTLGNMREIVDGFAEMGFPNCSGVIDGTHIPNLAPDELAMEYINWKGYFSMILQALMDHHGYFTEFAWKQMWGGLEKCMMPISLGHWPVQKAASRDFLSRPEDHYRGSQNAHSDPGRPSTPLNAMAHEAIHG